MIRVKKLDGSTMYINEDLIERVEGGAEGQSALYMTDGGHIIVANDPIIVVARVQREKVALLRGAAQGPEAASATRRPVPDITRLGRVSGQ